MIHELLAMLLDSTLPTITRSVLGILFTFWVMGFLIYEQKGSFFLPRGTGIKIRLVSGRLRLKRACGKFQPLSLHDNCMFAVGSPGVNLNPKP